MPSFKRFFDFFHERGHIFHRSSVNNGDIFCAKPYCRAGRVDSRISAADDDYFLPTGTEPLRL